jgi:hypothetical protein
MKRSTLKLFLSAAAVMGVAASASADLLYTFATDATGSAQGGGFVGGSYAWDSTYQAVQATTTVGGWNMGGQGPKFEFGWPSQTVMQQVANWGTGRVSFDMFVNDNSFLYWNNGASTWYQMHYAGNSDGAHGWTQDPGGSYNGTLGAPGSNNHTFHVDESFAQMGWDPGDTWFQIFFGGNSDNTPNLANALQFYIDNIHVTPEPTTFALAGLGAAALLFFRRR